MVQGVRQEQGGAAQFVIADDGTLAYLPAELAGHQNSLSWLDRSGAVTPLTREQRNYRSLSVSPSGEEIALGIAGEEGLTKLWILTRNEAH